MFQKNYYADKSPRATHLLISICVAVFAVEILAQYFYGSEFAASLIKEFGFSLVNIADMKLWTFFTSIFIHASPEHLLFNMIALYFFGRVVEEQLGWVKYLGIFFAGAISGGMAILLLSVLGLYSAVIPTVGASAAIFGLLGVSMFLKPFDLVIYPYLIPVPLVFIAVIYIMYNVADFILVLISGKTSEISYAAHIGGLIAGLLIGLKIEGRKKGLLLILLFVLIFLAILFSWKYLIFLENINYMSIFSQLAK